MGNIVVTSPRDLYNPMRPPDVSGLVPNITGIAPDDLRNQVLVPGDVVQLDGTTVNLLNNHEISGFAGTQANPIWILGNNSTFEDKAVELYNNEWVYWEDLNFNNSANNGAIIEDSIDCIYKNFTIDNTSNNGCLVRGTTTRPNSRLAFFDFGITNWASGDGFSVHASGSEEDNGSYFAIRNLITQNAVDTAEEGIDLTSGNFFYVWGYQGVDAGATLGHGVENAYIYDFTHNFDVSSVRDQSIKVRNTDGDIWFAKLSGNGEINLGTTGSPRSNETFNSVLPPNYITYELKVFDNLLSGGVNNNTSGLGTIVTSMDYNELGYLEFNGFNKWPLTL